jgi:hypothetical protein
MGYTQVDPKEVERAVAKHPPQGSYLKHLNHYTKEDLALIQKKLDPLMKKYGYEPLRLGNLHDNKN